MFTHKTSRDDRLRRGEHRHVSLHHVLQEQKERSSASSSPGFPCIWIKTLHISPRCKDIVITLAHKQIMFIQICICIYREREKFSRVRVILCIYIYVSKRRSGRGGEAVISFVFRSMWWTVKVDDCRATFFRRKKDRIGDLVGSFLLSKVGTLPIEV